MLVEHKGQLPSDKKIIPGFVPELEPISILYARTSKNNSSPINTVYQQSAKLKKTGPLYFFPSFDQNRGLKG